MHMLLADIENMQVGLVIRLSQDMAQSHIRPIGMLGGVQPCMLAFGNTICSLWISFIENLFEARHLRAIELIHEALVSNTVITKRFKNYSKWV